MIRIQYDDFDTADIYRYLRQAQPGKTGAIVLFTGLVRDFGDHSDVTAIELEHYPGMTEKSLQHIVNQASERWCINSYAVVHRVGRLKCDEQIVLVGVSSEHRGDAFAACEYIMDYLKSEAPLWKKEIRDHAADWVEAKESDTQRKQQWEQKRHSS
ncbi:MAG: molybdenum cofactor biosynthesis protein MoaE [Oleiphilaceae bacterium]|nr:molybdenum cofactor biosynthesis protein MoaE [Oleiphilaceae bacterium]